MCIRDSSWRRRRPPPRPRGGRRVSRLTGRSRRREEAIEVALSNKLADRAAKREMQAKAAQKEIEEFTLDFKNAARRCFELIDKDGGGTLSITEIVEAVKSDQEVISFLKTCGEENLMFLLHPPRLKKALEVLDTDGSGEVDVDEWRVARRPPWFHAVLLTSQSPPSTRRRRLVEA